VKKYPNNRIPTKDGISSEFLSTSLESLIHNNTPTPFDVIIVGSGYGGSTAAMELSKTVDASGDKLKIAVLERGTERLPGSFPEKLSDVPTEVRFYRNNHRDKENNYTFQGEGTGLFDIRIGKGTSTITANGLGGGSLINAGVLLKPKPSVFDQDQWPDEITWDTLADLFDEAKFILGGSIEDANGVRHDNTVVHAKREFEKYTALETLCGDGSKVTPVPITVKMTETDPHQQIQTESCIGCGDCFSGCNFNAKKSLDTNLLAEAALNGVEVITHASVLHFDTNSDDLWQVHIRHTDENIQRKIGSITTLQCRKLIIAAGTLGSTELLKRSEVVSKAGLTFSCMLGERFSGNGDMLATITDRSQRVNSVASEYTAPDKRNVGPTITGMLDYRSDEFFPMVIQDLSVPNILQRLLSESTAFTQTIHALTSVSKAFTTYSDIFCTLNPTGSLGRCDTVDRSNRKWNDGCETDSISVLAGMGLDKQFGRMFLSKKLEGNKTWRNLPQGVMNLEFGLEAKKDDNFYAKSMSRLRSLAKKNDKHSTVLPNPLWKPLGRKLGNIFKGEAPGMLVTVHPLGGCCMGENVQTGVVDPMGRVFQKNSAEGKTYDGLVVMDGSILPTPTGINPALTITTLALRSIRLLIDEWNLGYEENTKLTNVTSLSRPYYHINSRSESVKQTETELELVERLTGEVTLSTNGGSKKYIAELRLRSDPITINKLTRFSKRTVDLLSKQRLDDSGKLPSMSYLRLFELGQWNKLHKIEEILKDRDSTNKENPGTWGIKYGEFIREYDKKLDEYAVLIAPITGSIKIMEETPQNTFIRFAKAAVELFGRFTFMQAVKAMCALPGKIFRWAINTACAMVSSVKARWKGEIPDEHQPILSVLNKWLAYSSIFAHMGRERTLVYNVKVGIANFPPSMAGQVTSSTQQQLLHNFSNASITGHKSFQFKVHSNPWRQLMDVAITDFPMLEKHIVPTLSVDAAYFARNSVPLLHVHKEQSAIDGYTDLLSFYAHLARVFVLHHLWSFIQPGPKRTVTAIDKKMVAEKEAQNTSKPDTAEYRLPPLFQLASGIKSNRYSLNLDEPNRHIEGNPPINACLTRYRPIEPEASLQPPVICIHGYSASGTTFAHSTLYGPRADSGGLAAYLALEGRDVWVLDMRSSCALASGDSPWKFEDMAWKDIPKAIEQVCELTGYEKVDIVAHCMGAVMFSMAMLGPNTVDELSNHISVHNEIELVNNKVRNVVLSQAGPYMQFTPDNTFRSYLLKYIRNLLPINGYEFNPIEKGDDGLNLIDRLLSTLPYPDNTELEREGSSKDNAYWVRIRRRMDALYGRTFSLKNMTDQTLNHIDDFFGPFSFRTLEQTLWLSDRKQITNEYGEGYHMSGSQIKQSWYHPTLWIIGEENGLIDPRSPSLMASVCDKHMITNFRFWVAKNCGHQDTLMGKDCEKIFSSIAEHLTLDNG